MNPNFNNNFDYSYNNINPVNVDQNPNNIQMMQMNTMNTMALGQNNGMNIGPNLGMGMNIGLGLGTGGGVSNGMLNLNGNCMTIQSYMENLKTNSQTQIFNAKINITGNQIQEMNQSCLIATIVGGSLIILPIFFMCCGWWKKIVYPAYDVPLSTYQSLQALLVSGKIKVLALTVIDSTFNNQKAAFLYDLVSRYQLKGFSFINTAMELNFNGSQYSDFVKNMKAFKSLPMMSEIRWGSEIVL